MYLDDSQQFGFIHIPKTGGTTIIKSLFTNQGHLRRVGARHSRLEDHDDWMSYWDYRFVAVVRDPYRRLASSYRFNLGRHKLGSFEWFLTDPSINSEWSIRQVDYISHSFICPEIYKYEELDKAIDAVCEIAKVGRGYILKNERVNHFGDYDYRDFLSEEGVDYINEYCNEDFVRFGYEMKTWGELIGQAD